MSLTNEYLALSNKKYKPWFYPVCIIRPSLSISIDYFSLAVQIMLSHSSERLEIWFR